MLKDHETIFVSMENILKTFFHYKEPFVVWKVPSMDIKGIVHPIMINYSPSCHSKPVRSLFIFGTQIKIFLMKSESFLTLHRQQGSYYVQGTER